jgi:phosphoribosylaminoimidazole-succinocarboxamide synthase
MRETTIVKPSGPAVTRTDLPLPERRQGKVRDIYSLPAAGGQPSRVLIIATDRISAFDVVLPTPIPGKGRLLTEISVSWFQFIRKLGLVSDHLLSTEPADVPALSAQQRQQIEGRMMLGRAAKVIPIECVVRGYLAGSGWADYRQNGSVCGIRLPAGLKRCDRLPEPIFTPATKAVTGHDENIDFKTASGAVGEAVMTRLRDVSLALYRAAAGHAESRGIILADTKFEFGFPIGADGSAAGDFILIDEVFTPDSSRFWPADSYEPGREQESFDKQFVRNYLQALVDGGKWDKSPPGPELPEDVVSGTLSRYVEARERLFGPG